MQYTSLCHSVVESAVSVCREICFGCPCSVFKTGIETAVNFQNIRLMEKLDGNCSKTRISFEKYYL